jgi:hypothetical protein
MGDTAGSVDDIIVTHELGLRRARAPDLAAENRALHQLARQTAREPEPMLDALLHIALELCSAGSAGKIELRKESVDLAAALRCSVLDEPGRQRTHACVEVGAPTAWSA